MKTYFKNDELEIIVNDLKEISKAIQALNLFGKEVVSINLNGCAYLDIDTDMNPYYKRYDERILDIVYRDITRIGGVELVFKNNRLYYNVENTDVILPKDMHSYFGEGKLSICIKYKEAV